MESAVRVYVAGGEFDGEEKVGLESGSLNRAGVVEQIPLCGQFSIGELEKQMERFEIERDASRSRSVRFPAGSSCSQNCVDVTMGRRTVGS